MHSLLVRDAMLGRRSALGALLGLGAGAAIGLGGAAPLEAAAAPPKRSRSATLDFTNPIDNLYAFGKIWCGYEKPVIGGFHGLMYLRIPGKRLMPVFGYTGTGIMMAEYRSERLPEDQVARDRLFHRSAQRRHPRDLGQPADRRALRSVPFLQ